ncbi:DEAD/DEAH box helicase [Nocardioides ultimimeridianus]
MPSLFIGFGSGPTTVRLQGRAGLETELRELALRFPNVRHIAPSLAEVPLDDLLVNLRQVANWQHEDVEWEDRLLTIVSDSLRDAEVVANVIANNAALPLAIDLDASLGTRWTGDLTSFQRRDIEKLLSLRHGANFSVPGAGKTRVGLAVFQALREIHGIERVLIVGPKSCYESWLQENAACLAPPLRMEIFDSRPNPGAEALIINYERLAPSVAALGQWLSARPSLLLLDEAHRMKLGPDGTYGAACLALGPHARHRLILTGTPAPNGVRDLENLFGFVWPGTGRQRVVQAVASGDLAAASRALRPLFTRTTKTELGLPKVTPVVRRVDLPPIHQEIYDALIGQMSARASGTEDLEDLGRIIVYLLMAATSPALLSVGTTRYEPLAYRVPPLDAPPGSSLAQLMTDLPNYELSPKYREVLQIVRDNAANGRKTLVWSTFIRSLNTLRELLSAFSPALVHGGTEDRDAEIQRFRTDPSCMVLLSNPATLGEGISLHHECNDAVYVDRDFAAGRYLQSLDRIHRLGLRPDAKVRVTVLVSSGTIDEVVEQRLGMKLDFMGRVLDDPAVRELADLDEEPAFGGGLDRGDLQALIGYLRADPT